MVTPVKISNALKTPDASRDGKVNLTSITPRYSSICGWNLDSSLMLLEHSGYYAVYDGAGKYLRDLPFEIAGSNANPVWSRTDRQLVYFVVGKSVKSYNVNTRAIALVKQFTEYAALTTFGESDISQDGTFLVLAGDGKHVFALNLATKVKSRSIELPGIESIHLTPKNNVLVKYHTNGTARFQGCELFSGDMAFIRQVIPYNAHADMMLNGNGDEILIHGNGAAAIVATNLTKVEAPAVLFKSVSGLAEHISCPIGRDFFFVDRYDPLNVIPGDIMKIWLDGKTEILCLHGSKAFPPENKYSYQPKVSTNREGTKLVYASNSGIGTPLNYSDTFMLTMAETAKPAAPQPTTAEVLTFDLSKYDCEIKKGILTVRAA